MVTMHMSLEFFSIDEAVVVARSSSSYTAASHTRECGTVLLIVGGNNRHDELGRPKKTRFQAQRSQVSGKLVRPSENRF